MTWSDVFRDLLEIQRLRWTIRFLLVKLAFVKMRHWLRGRMTA